MAQTSPHVGLRRDLHCSSETITDKQMEVHLPNYEDVKLFKHVDSNALDKYVFHTQEIRKEAASTYWVHTVLPPALLQIIVNTQITASTD